MSAQARTDSRPSSQADEENRSRRLAYLVPGPLGRTSEGSAELERRNQVLQSWASAGTTVALRAVEEGPASIESAYEEYLSIPPTAELVAAVEEQGFDAAVLGCFGDPGLDALREITSMPVIGPARAAMTIATNLGHRFSILTVSESVVPLLRRVAWEAGVSTALASIESVETPVLELQEQRGQVIERLADRSRRACDAGADVLVLGCMSMGFLGVAEELTDAIGIPTVNPVLAGLKVAELMVDMGLTHSKTAYPVPPKMAAGAQLDDLHTGG